VGRSLKTDIPGPDRRVSVAEVREKGWEAIFAPDLRPHRLVVELGCGDGEYLRHLAAQAPQVAHVGVERSSGRVLKLARRIAAADEANIRLLCATAEEVTREVLGPASVERFWVNFPDPWPKRRHQRRRLLKPPFVRELAQRLVPGGWLHVATDHEDYAGAIDAALRGEPLLENALAPQAFVRDVPGRLHTAYESRWRAEGRRLHFWTYRRTL